MQELTHSDFRLTNKKMTHQNRMQSIRYHEGVVHFEKSTPPKGYLTGDEFERRCIANISKFYHDKGLL